MSKAFRVSFTSVLMGVALNGGCFGHPGHDPHLPQTGFVHWFASPVHVVAILSVIALLVGVRLLFSHRNVTGASKNKNLSVLSSKE